ncbi:MAG: MBL fold metallo-hydrolase [Nitrososphaeraceae archaeon]|nr:MBL fold metallo-hydrolase [Nitrososphaeraceae archaeon]
MTQIAKNIYSVEGLEIPIPGVNITPYIVQEDDNGEDLTLIDTGYISEMPKFETYLDSIGLKLKNIKRIILTHLHIDHIQAANYIKKISNAKIYSHWLEAPFISKNIPYPGPPSQSTLQQIYDQNNLKIDDILKRFGRLDAEPIQVDSTLDDLTKVKSLTVIHTPGHTFGHIALYHEESKILFGADMFSKNAKYGIIEPTTDFFIDPLVTSLSIVRTSNKIKFDKLYLSHQDKPILENANNKMAKIGRSFIDKIVSQMKSKGL